MYLPPYFLRASSLISIFLGEEYLPLRELRTVLMWQPASAAISPCSPHLTSMCFNFFFLIYFLVYIVLYSLAPPANVGCSHAWNVLAHIAQLVDNEEYLVGGGVADVNHSRALFVPRHRIRRKVRCRGS